MTTSQACDRVLKVRVGGPKVNPVTHHVKRPSQEGPNIRPGEGQVKEPTKTDRPPSTSQKQGVCDGGTPSEGGD